MPTDSADTFDTRRRELIDYFAARTGDDEYTARLGLFEVGAALVRLRETDGTELDSRHIHILNDCLVDPHGDMFWMLPMAFVHAVGREILPAPILEKMRGQWRTYTPYRGDTANHWLMYYASLLVMCDLYPDDGPDGWFNGRSSQENGREASEYLRHWFHLVFSAGQNEFDSPHYLPMYLAPLSLLVGFASDAAMRDQAATMLDLLIADFAADSNNGLYVGAFSRIYPEPLLDRSRNPSTTFAWLLFGNIRFRPDPINIILPRIGYRPHAAAVVLAASGYSPKPDLVRIATERTTPYVHRELKRSRNHIRYAQNRYSEVYKYAYVCREFAMGSAATRPATKGREKEEGSGLVQPIQQHTWELIWTTEDSRDQYNLLFGLHPNAGPYEMGLFFPEEPRLLTSLVSSQEKPTYDKAQKWTGGSPYEQVFQHENCIVTLYCIPEDTRFPFVSTFVSRELGEFREQDGWLVAEVENVYVAYYPFAPYERRDDEDGNSRLHSEHLNNGCIVQCSPRVDFADLSAFCRSLGSPEVDLGPVPSVRFSTVSGAEIVASYGELPIVDGSAVDYSDWPVFDGPFIRSARGSGEVNILDGRGGVRKLSLLQ